MNTTSRTLTGGILIALGLVMIGVDMFLKAVALSIWGAIFLIVGLVIFFNRSEDKIEERKDLKSKKGRK